MKHLEILLQQAKTASFAAARLSAKKKTTILLAMAHYLSDHRKEIFEANKKDVKRAKEKGLTNAFIDRLALTEKGFAGMIEQLKIVANLEDASKEIIEKRLLPNGVELQKIRFPIGVIAMIYESRPNVTVDAAGLSFKSGNAVILKGGSEALLTNTALVGCIHSVLKRFAVSLSAVTFLDNVTHKDIAQLLTRSDLIDVVIPRGSYALTSAVAKKSRIPVLYHSSGGARMYIDKSADPVQALEICINSKTNRTGVCNALDMVLVHKDIAKNILPMLDAVLLEKDFEVRAERKAKLYMLHATKATAEDFKTEFLDSILAVKVVEDVDEALGFIKRHSHHHTEVLSAKDNEVIERFVYEIDAAGLMINCASRLHDGGEFGIGTEIGIATGKLHARGPVGIRELTTYKWIAYGNGQIKK